MCFPPFCHPAQHVLGCFGLRQGAGGVLVINAFYGLALVVVHALLLGEVGKDDAGGEVGGQATPAAAPAQEAYGGRRMAEERNEGVGWLVQIIDLDIGWGHRLMGFDDETNLVAGLIYGIVIICVCAYMFHSVQTGGGGLGLPTTCRWFVAFMNLELLIYVGVVLVKLPELCKMQAKYMPNLNMECSVQRFMFLQRMAVYITGASLCVWVFASFAFSLTFGNAAMDRPEFQHELDYRDAVNTGKAPPQSHHGPPTGLAPPSPYQTRHDTRHSVSPPTRQSLVGGAVHAPSFQSQRSGAGAHRTSYNIGSMARAGSSYVSTTSDNSHPETQALIKPPLHVF